MERGMNDRDGFYILAAGTAGTGSFFLVIRFGMEHGEEGDKHRTRLLVTPVLAYYTPWSWFRRYRRPGDLEGKGPYPSSCRFVSARLKRQWNGLPEPVPGLDPGIKPGDDGHLGCPSYRAGAPRSTTTLPLLVMQPAAAPVLPTS
jgi:hypothetical protein